MEMKLTTVVCFIDIKVIKRSVGTHLCAAKAFACYADLLTVCMNEPTIVTKAPGLYNGN